MRYAVIQVLPPLNPGEPARLSWVATDLCKSSAKDALRAWEYQASRLSGWMEIIEDSQQAFDNRKRESIGQRSVR
jgi:hypothetical protein